MAVLFDLSVLGPPPGTATVGSNLWIDMGLVTVGKKNWFGMMKLTGGDKAITMELRTNLATKSAATTGDTLLLSSCSVSTRTPSITMDLYKGGRLHTATVIGTGVEKWWLRLTSKSSLAASYLYQVTYCLE